MATLFLSVCFIVLLVQLPTIEAYVTAVKSGAEVSVISSGFKTDSPIVEKIKKEAPNIRLPPSMHGWIRFGKPFRG
jgi:hypothetical protein